MPEAEVGVVHFPFGPHGSMVSGTQWYFRISARRPGKMTVAAQRRC